MMNAERARRRRQPAMAGNGGEKAVIVPISAVHFCKFLLRFWRLLLHGSASHIAGQALLTTSPTRNSPMTTPATNAARAATGHAYIGFRCASDALMVL